MAVSYHKPAHPRNALHTEQSRTVRGNPTPAQSAGSRPRSGFGESLLPGTGVALSCNRRISSLCRRAIKTKRPLGDTYPEGGRGVDGAFRPALRAACCGVGSRQRSPDHPPAWVRGNRRTALTLLRSPNPCQRLTWASAVPHWSAEPDVVGDVPEYSRRTSAEGQSHLRATRTGMMANISSAVLSPNLGTAQRMRMGPSTKPAPNTSPDGSDGVAGEPRRFGGQGVLKGFTTSTPSRWAPGCSSSVRRTVQPGK